MKKFRYYVPMSLSEAIKLLGSANDNTHILAGGTDIVIAMHQKRITADVVVDIKKIKELEFIEEDNGKIRIGALTTFTALERSELINQKARVLALACSEVGSTQVRNIGTIGGNVVNASPAADSVPALIALNAVAVIESIDGTREIAIKDIFEGMHKTKLNKNEILTHICFKALSGNVYTGFRKLGRRAALAIARISVVAVMEKHPHASKWRDVRIALGSVAENPFRAKEAEDILKDAEIRKDKVEECVQKIAEIASITLGDRASAPFKRESIKGIAREVIVGICSEANSYYDLEEGGA